MEDYEIWYRLFVALVITAYLVKHGETTAWVIIYSIAFIFLFFIVWVMLWLIV